MQNKQIIVQSFGYGFLGTAPENTHIEEDVRNSLRNPYVKEQNWEWLRAIDGTHPELQTFVLCTEVAEGCETAQQILKRLASQAIELLAYQDTVVVSIGCRAGRHRSPALAELLVALLHSQGYPAFFQHISLSDALQEKPLRYN